jgi:hypothetical protein
VPYGFVSRIEIRPVIWLTPGAWESRVPVDTCFAPWLYISLYPFLYVTGLMVSELIFRRYVVALAVASIISAVIFLLIPSGVPRDGIDAESASWLYGVLVSIDAPRNAFPSEHASLAVIAVLAIFAERRSAVLKAGACVWLVMIYWATIATRQHVIFDLASGAALGVGVWLLQLNKRIFGWKS